LKYPHPPAPLTCLLCSFLSLSLSPSLLHQAELKSTQTRLGGELSQRQADIATLEADLSYRKQAVAKLEAELKTTQQTMQTELAARTSKLEADLAERAARVAALEAENERLRGELRRAEEAMMAMRADKGKSEGQVRLASGLVKKIEAELATSMRKMEEEKGALFAEMARRGPAGAAVESDLAQRLRALEAHASSAGIPLSSSSSASASASAAGALQSGERGEDVIVRLEAEVVRLQGALLEQQEDNEVRGEPLYALKIPIFNRNDVLAFYLVFFESLCLVIVRPASHSPLPPLVLTLTLHLLPPSLPSLLSISSNLFLSSSLFNFLYTRSWLASWPCVRRTSPASRATAPACS
jgi:hypothetical protein